MLNWTKRLTQWAVVVRWSRGKDGRVPWMNMLLAILSGPVPRSVWRQRIRTCLHCPLYRGDLRACSSTHPDFMGLGCHCNTTMLALFAEPYPGGCIAKYWGDETIGWAAYRFPSIWHRIAAPIRFIFAR